MPKHKEKICAFCGNDHYHQGSQIQADTGEVRMFFDSGRSYVVHCATPHLIMDHKFQPSPGFIGDVMNSRLISEDHYAESYVVNPEPVGFLGDDFLMGSVPVAFTMRLLAMIREQKRSGGE